MWPEATPFYVTASYDALNRPTALLENGSVKLANYTYDDLSRRTLVTLANGTTTGYSYDPQSGLKTLTQNLTGTAQDNTWTYTRNQAQDIKTDAWTNDLYRWTGYTNGTRTYSVNGRNQYAVQTTTGSTHSNGSSTFNYDANANLTGDGVWTYAYNLENRLTSASKTGWAATLNYDGEGRLTRTTLAGVVTNLTYDNVNLLAEYNASGTLLRRYVHGPGIDQPLVWYEGATTTSKNWLYTDHQGSIIATANSTGNSTATYSYGPYGEPNQTTGVRFRYTGQQLIGPLNLYYYKARFYSPAVGRFLQTDPIGYQDDLNLYVYVGGNPLNKNDPSGMITKNEMRALLQIVNTYGFIQVTPNNFKVDPTMSGGHAGETNFIGTSTIGTSPAENLQYSGSVIANAKSEFVINTALHENFHSLEGAISGGIFNGLDGRVEQWTKGDSSLAQYAADTIMQDNPNIVNEFESLVSSYDAATTKP